MGQEVSFMDAAASIEIASGSAAPLGALRPPEGPLRLKSRRYLGGKFRLLGFIKSVVARHCPEAESFADLFAGTGVVAAAFAGKRLVVNDSLYANHVCHLAWLSPEPFDGEKISRLIAGYNALEATADNYMSDNFSGTFFSRADCRKIGSIREDIEARFGRGEISFRERAMLIASLIYAADKIANTCGHYDAFRRGAPLVRHLRLRAPEVAVGLHPGSEFHNEDANLLAARVSADLAYLDPPYNSRQYCDSYHLLENLARWEMPPLKGAVPKMDRAGLKSDYCTRRAPDALEALVRSLSTPRILLSYNNMAGKGDKRSNAKISEGEILEILKAKGRAKVFKRAFQPFSAGRSEISRHEERLYLCECG